MILAVLGAMYYFYNSVQKGIKEDDERETLNGKTVAELTADLKPKWLKKWKSSQISYFNSEVMQDQIFAEALQLAIDKNLEKSTAVLLVETKNNTEKFIKNALEKIKNPLDVKWAVDWWLPKQLTPLGLKMDTTEVQQAIRKII